MAFKKKQDVTSGEQFKFENEGDTLTGYYLGSFAHEGDYGPTKKHLFKTEKGIKVVFGQTHLTQLLEGEPQGILVRVTYENSKKMRKGNPMKMYALDIDSECVLDGVSVSNSVSDANTGSDEEEDDVSNYEQEEEVHTAIAKPTLSAKAPNAAQQQKVNDLLARTRSATK